MIWLAAAVVLIVSAALLVARAARPGILPTEGAPAPGFSLPDQHDQTHSLEDYRGHWLVLYFYPRDDTPGCTQEACTFRDDLHQLAELGAQVVGVSVDDSYSHAAFAEKHHLPFTLLADRKGKVADSYGALMNLTFVKLACRYTYLIDPQGNLAKVYLRVETSRHSQEIIEDLKKLTVGGAV